MRASLALCLTAGSALPSGADIFTRPEDCERLATVQYDNCRVENVFRCAKDTDKYIRIENADSEEFYSVWTYNFRTETASLNYRDGTETTYRYSGDQIEDAVKHGSAQEHFESEIFMFGLRKPISGEHNYFYDGETEVIAGLEFHKLRAETVRVNPYPMGDDRSRQLLLLNTENDLAVVTEEADVSDPENTLTVRMKELALPGQAGFGDETARYGCAQISRADFDPTETPA